MPTMRIPYGVLDGRYINSAGDSMIGQLTLNNGLIVPSGYTGVGTSTPDRRLDVLDAVMPQLRLAHTNGTLYTDFQTDSNGDLYITPSGLDVKLPNCLLTINGAYRSNYGHFCIHGTTSNHAFQTIYYNNVFTGWYGLLSNNFGFCMYNGGSGGNMIFYSKPSQGESARFDANGNLGIGTTGPDRKLDVLDSANPQLRLTQTDGSNYSDFQTTSAGNLTITTSGGGVYIGSTTVSNLGTFIINKNISSGTGNYRGLRDETTFSRSGTVAYACFDAEASLNGSYDYDHIVGFQSRPRHISTGTLSQLAGFSSITYNSGGTVASAWGFRAYDVAGIGLVTNNYGVYINSLTRGTNNYAIYTDGNTKSYFGGNVGIGATEPTSQLQVGSNSGYGVTTGLLVTSNLIGGSYDRATEIAPRQTAAASGNSILLYMIPTINSGVTQVRQFGLLIGNKQGSGAITSYVGLATSVLGATNNTHLLLGTTAAIPPSGNYAIYDETGYQSYLSGNVGIGTTPDRKLDVLDASNPQLRLTHTDGSVFTDFQTTSDGGLKISPSGNKIGFFGVTPASRAEAYTTSSVTTDRSYNADATTLAEIADVLGTLINDLKAYGLLQ